MTTDTPTLSDRARIQLLTLFKRGQQPRYLCREPMATTLLDLGLAERRWAVNHRPHAPKTKIEHLCITEKGAAEVARMKASGVPTQ